MPQPPPDPARLALFEQWTALAHKIARQVWNDPGKRAQARAAGHGLADLVQICLAAFWRATAGYDAARGSFGAYAGTMAGRACRRALRNGAPSADLPWGGPADDAKPIDDDLADRLLAEEARRRLQALPPSLKDPLTRWLAGETQRHIAGRRSPQSVSDRIARARRRLRDSFHPDNRP